MAFFRAAGRLQPVQAFLEELEPVERRVAAGNQLERLSWLRVQDPPLPAPWDEPVEAELHALRLRVDGELLRLIYRRTGNLFLLLHAIWSAEASIPEHELRVARRASAQAQGVRPRAGALDSPIGQSLQAYIAGAELDEQYRDARVRLSPFEQVARLLIRYRMDHGLSQTQLARRAGISQQVVARIETGHHHVNLDTVAKVAVALQQRLLIAFEPYS
ncbi:MAG: helix-turn-helix domain-containing protein [Candidatus Dormibacteraeota bacterium]|nr:helix-turn-helix domain-containing protein [Candidatus Dormibacteraeota bacterium]